MANRYYNGEVVNQSFEHAIYYWRCAADQNIPGADSLSTISKFNLGTRYEKGEGVKKSKEEAIRYYKMAADQGNEEKELNNQKN